MPLFSPPAANTWDVDVVSLGALAALRLENDDVDADRVAAAAVEATQMIDIELDMRPAVDDPETPAFDAGAVPTLVQAAIAVTVELYLRTPAAQGDPVAGVRTQILPWKERFGCA